MFLPSLSLFSHLVLQVALRQALVQVACIHAGAGRHGGVFGVRR